TGRCRAWRTSTACTRSSGTTRGRVGLRELVDVRHRGVSVAPTRQTVVVVLPPRGPPGPIACPARLPRGTGSGRRGIFLDCVNRIVLRLPAPMALSVHLADLRHNFSGILANDCMPLGVAYMQAVMDRHVPDVRTR